MKAGIRVDVIDTVAGLRPLEPSWNELLAGSDSAHPMCSYAWVVSFVEHLLGPEASWFCLFAYDGPDLIGVLPVVERRSLPALRVIERSPPMDGLTTLSVGITARRGREDEVVNALLKALLHGERGGFSRMTLPRQRPDTVLDALVARHDGLRVTTASGEVGSFLRVPDDFDSYRASLSGNFRRNLNKAGRKFDALSGARFFFLDGADATEAQLDDFGAVEADGWKGKAGTAITQSESFTAFYRSATRRLARAEWLEWHFAEADDELIAAHMAVRCGRNLLLWKIGFRERFSFCAPGNLLFQEMVRRRVLSRDVDTIDVITNYPWHRLWRLDEREYCDVALYRRSSAVASVQYLGHLAKPALRRILRRSD